MHTASASCSTNWQNQMPSFGHPRADPDGQPTRRAGSSPQGRSGKLALVPDEAKARLARGDSLWPARSCFSAQRTAAAGAHRAALDSSAHVAGVCTARCGLHVALLGRGTSAAGPPRWPWHGWGTLGEGTQNLDELGCHIDGRLEGSPVKDSFRDSRGWNLHDTCGLLCSAPMADWPVLCGHGCRGWQGDLGQERGRGREQPGRVRGALAGDAGRGVREERGQERAGRLAGAQEC